MAKLAFSKLQKIKTIPEIIDTALFEGCELKVKQYLPLSEKMNILTNVLEFSGADEGYFNEVQLLVFYQIEMIKAYTNITFTDAQLKDIEKLYDSICINQIWEKVSVLIPEDERLWIWNAIFDMAREITTYNRSFAGMMKTVSTDYSNIETGIEELQKKITSPEIMNMVKNILPEAGLNA